MPTLSTFGISDWLVVLIRTRSGVFKISNIASLALLFAVRAGLQADGESIVVFIPEFVQVGAHGAKDHPSILKGWSFCLSEDLAHLVDSISQLRVSVAVELELLLPHDARECRPLIVGDDEFFKEPCIIEHVEGSRNGARVFLGIAELGLPLIVQIMKYLENI